MSINEAMAKAGIELMAAGAAVREHAYRSGSLEQVREARRFTDAGRRMMATAARGGYARKFEPPGRNRLALAGSVVKTIDERRFALFVAYSANKMPARGADGKLDLASPEVLERACWKFATNGLKVGVDHKPGGETAARVVENFVHRGPAWHVVGPDGTEEVVSEGDWCVGLVFSPEAWADFKAGRWSGVSLQGTATRKAPTAETLQRQRGK